MATQDYDIAVTFPTNGCNISSFNSQYISSLQAFAFMTFNDARDYAKGTGVTDGTRPPGNGQTFTAGTLNVGIGDGTVSNDQQAAIDATIQLQTGDETGATLGQLSAGTTAGDTIYVTDGTRQNPATGSGSLVYWDGTDSWRYVRDDTIAVTP